MFSHLIPYCYETAKIIQDELIKESRIIKIFYKCQIIYFPEITPKITEVNFTKYCLVYNCNPL